LGREQKKKEFRRPRSRREARPPEVKIKKLKKKMKVRGKKPRGEAFESSFNFSSLGREKRNSISRIQSNPHSKGGGSKKQKTREVPKKVNPQGPQRGVREKGKKKVVFANPF